MTASSGSHSRSALTIIFVRLPNSSGSQVSRSSVHSWKICRQRLREDLITFRAYVGNSEGVKDKKAISIYDKTKTEETGKPSFEVASTTLATFIANRSAGSYLFSFLLMTAFQPLIFSTSLSLINRSTAFFILWPWSSVTFDLEKVSVNYCSEDLSSSSRLFSSKVIVRTQTHSHTRLTALPRPVIWSVKEVPYLNQIYYMR